MVMARGAVPQDRTEHPDNSLGGFPAIHSEVGNLENTTSLLSLFYAGFVSVVVVIITDY